MAPASLITIQKVEDAQVLQTTQAPIFFGTNLLFSFNHQKFEIQTKHSLSCYYSVGNHAIRVILRYPYRPGSLSLVGIEGENPWIYRALEITSTNEPPKNKNRP